MIRNLNKLTTTALIAVMASVNLTLPVAGKNSLQLVGKLSTSGDVMVNGKRAIDGSSVFNDSRVSVLCNSGSTAIVNLGKLGRIQLSPGTELVVRFSEGLISGELFNGKAVVTNTEGVKINFTTPEGVTASDGKVPGALAVSTQQGTRCVPMTAKGSGKSGGSGGGGGGGGGAAIGAGGAAAIAAGAGVAAVATGVAVSGRKNPDFNASFTLP